MMNVRTLCLAILHHQDATGYEIRKLSTEGRYAYFVDASFGSIYPALAKLEADGLVTSRQEQQAGKPPRKVYMINEAGRAALRAQVKEPPGPDVFRSEFLLVGMCADLLDEGDLARAIEVHMRNIEAELAMLEEMRKGFGDSWSCWLTDYGATCLGTQLAWLKANRERVAAEGDAQARGRPAATAEPDFASAAE